MAHDDERDAVEIAGVRITHPDRVVFPEQDLTKGEIAGYYDAVAERILPHLRDRPLSLVRCPEGRDECFYQKHVGDSFPDAVGRVEIEEKDGDVGLYAVVNDRAALIGLVQMGVLEIHPWGARRDRLDRPDLLTWDLDPGPDVDYGTVVDGARAVRDRLDELGLRSFVKTSGGKGLHVVIPIQRRTGWEAARAFTRGVAQALADADPDRFLAQASKEKRRGKVFVDYLRNSRGATSVAPYSTRARPGAPVSMPLAWDEIGSTGPADYTVENAPRRIASQRSDPWGEIHDLAQSLTREAFAALGIEPPGA